MTADEELELRATVEAHQHLIVTLLTLLLQAGRLDGDDVQDYLLGSVAILDGPEPVNARAAEQLRFVAKHLDSRPPSSPPES